MNGYIVSINVSKPHFMNVKEREQIFSGINKKPVKGLVVVGKHNLAGDGQADLSVHGGPDKAVCLYPYEHYAYWENSMQVPLSTSAFGENITLRGLTEKNVHIGDVFKSGTAIFQVTQPRQPCYKLAKKLSQPDIPLRMQQTGYTGFYCRVLQEGEIKSSDSFKLLDRNPDSVSVNDANHVKYMDKQNIEAMKKIISIQGLSNDWRVQFQNRVNRLEGELKPWLQ